MANEVKEIVPPLRSSLSLPRNSTAFSRVPVLSAEIPASLLQCSVCSRDVARDNHYFLCHHPSHRSQSKAKSSADAAIAAGVDARLLSQVQSKHQYGLVFCSVCEPSHDPLHLVIKAASTLFTQKTSLPDFEDTRVHCARCSLCGVFPIVGTRLSCATCADYDLCATCGLTAKHQSRHMLIKYRKPVSVVEPGFEPGVSPSAWDQIRENFHQSVQVCYLYNASRMEFRNALRILGELSKFISRDKPIATYDDLFYLVSNLAWLEVYNFSTVCDHRVQEFLHATLYSNVPDGAYYALRAFSASSTDTSAYKDMDQKIRKTLLYQLVDYVYSLQKRFQCGETLELELQPLYEWMNQTIFRQTKESILLLRSITIAVDKRLHRFENWKRNLDSVVLAIFIGIFTAIFSKYVMN